MDLRNRDNPSERSCWVCASKNHLARKCPNRPKGSNGASSKLVSESTQVVSRGPPPTKVHSVQVEGHTAETALKTNLCTVTLAEPNQVSEFGTEVNSCAAIVCDTGKVTSGERDNCEITDLAECMHFAIGSNGVEPMVNCNRENCMDSLDGDADCLLLKTHSADMTAVPEQSGRKETLSPLEYIHVCIAEVPTVKSLPALIDIGSDICVMHRRLSDSYQ